ncbi:putative glycolipid-binding domain-containing protein [Microbacterium sp. 2P01SA-2]|uniref:putative glycolipid-binding domain-containing protein n=1 Tax=unclassified Microbacterium TaxID=2609290 RepID=UPI0039A3E366
MRTTRISWTGIGSAETIERCTTEYSDEGIRMVGEVDGGDEGCRYAIRLGVDGGFRHATVAAGERSIAIENIEGTWTVDGEPRPDLAGATDLDITATPATNALPIRRLRLAVGSRDDIEVAWVQVPSLEVRLSRQRYTRVGPRAYCFESRDHDFRRTLTVDEDGFVLSYPGLFERVTGS